MMKNFPVSTVLAFADQVSYQEGQVVSKTLAQDKNHSLTIFAFDKGEEIRAHASDGDALVLALDGIGEVTIEDQKYVLKSGESILMPAHRPHAVFAPERFKMFLVVIF